MSVKESVFNDRKDRYEEINRFRNGYITRHLTSVDVGEVVRVGGIILEFIEGFIFNNLDYNLLENLVSDKFAKQNKFKEEKEDLSNLNEKTNKQTLFMGVASDEKYMVLISVFQINGLKRNMMIR